MLDPHTSRRTSTRAGLSLPALAAELEVSYRTVLKAVKEGHVRVIHFGPHRLVTRKEAERLKSLLRDTVGDEAA